MSSPDRQSPDRHTATDEQLTIVDLEESEGGAPSLTSAPEVYDTDPRAEIDETPADDADIAEERIEAFAEARGEAAVDRGPFPEEERERRREHAREELEQRARGEPSR